MDQTFMKEKKIFPLVLSMSLPMVISMLVNSLYNIVDSFYVAQLGEEAMTALSIVFPLQNLANAAGVGFGIGVNAAVAYFLGAGNRAYADKSAFYGTALSILHGVLLCAVCLPVSSYFFGLFTSNAAVLEYSVDYFYIVIAFAPVITLGINFEKILQAVGMMKTTMFCMAAGCALNIILDPLFISGTSVLPAMGVRGAAVATGLGQSVSLLLYVAVMIFKRMPVKLRRVKEVRAKGLIRRLYVVGIPATLNMALASFLITALNAILAAFAEVYVLILGVYYKLQTFIYFTANGIIQGIRPLVAYNYGAERPDRVKKIFAVALSLSAAIMALGTVLCLAIPSELMGIFTDNADTLSAGAAALRIISCGFIVSAASVAVSGMFEGLGKGMPSLIISLLRYIAIIPIAYGLSRVFGADGVWNAFWVTELAAAAVSVLLVVLQFRRMRSGTGGNTQEYARAERAAEA